MVALAMELVPEVAYGGGLLQGGKAKENHRVDVLGTHREDRERHCEED